MSFTDLKQASLGYIGDVADELGTRPLCKVKADYFQLFSYPCFSLLEYIIIAYYISFITACICFSIESMILNQLKNSMPTLIFVENV